MWNRQKHSSRKKIRSLIIFQPKISRKSAPKVSAQASAIWFQLGLGNEEPARRAEAAGMRVVWDRCTAIEHRRLERERRVRAGAT